MSEEMNDRSSNSSMSNDDEDEDEDNDSSGNPRTSLNFSVMSDSDDGEIYLQNMLFRHFEKGHVANF